MLNGKFQKQFLNFKWQVALSIWWTPTLQDLGCDSFVQGIHAVYSEQSFSGFEGTGRGLGTHLLPRIRRQHCKYALCCSNHCSFCFQKFSQLVPGPLHFILKTTSCSRSILYMPALVYDSAISPESPVPFTRDQIVSYSSIRYLNFTDVLTEVWRGEGTCSERQSQRHLKKCL